MNKTAIIKAISVILIAVTVLCSAMCIPVITRGASEAEAGPDKGVIALVGKDGTVVRLNKEKIIAAEKYPEDFYYIENGKLNISEREYYSLEDMIKKSFPDNDEEFDLLIAGDDAGEQPVRYSRRDVKSMYLFEEEEGIFSVAVYGGEKERWFSSPETITLTDALTLQAEDETGIEDEAGGTGPEDTIFITLPAIRTVSEHKWKQQVDNKYTGLAQEEDGTWYYLVNGKIDTSYTNLVFNYGIWFYVHNGRITWGTDTLAQLNSNGDWYKITNAMIDWGYNGLSYYEDNWFYIKNGVIDWNYSNLVQNYGMWFYVHHGRIDWNYSTLSQLNGTGNWFKVTNGMIDWGYNGLSYYESSWFYIKNGEIDWGYHGLINYYDTWFYVKGGCIDWNYSNLVQNYGMWFYVYHGKIDWGVDTIAQLDGRGNWYKIKNAMIDWNYTGKYSIYGKEYRVVNGVVREYVDGVDVSDHNGYIDWADLKNRGIKFAIIRIGYGNDIEAQDDKMAGYNMQQCEKYGIPYGVYIYSYALNNDDLDSEIRHTYRMIQGRNPVMGIWFDMEDADGYKLRNNMNPYANGNTLTNFCLRFIRGMNARGYYNVGVYANTDYFRNVLNYRAIANEGMVWLAHWGISQPTGEFPSVMWQYGQENINGMQYDKDRIYYDSSLFDHTKWYE